MGDGGGVGEAMQKGPVAGTMGSGRRMAIGSPGNAAVAVLGGGGLIVKWSCLIVCEQTMIVRCIQSRLLFFEERERQTDRQTIRDRERK